MLADTPKQAVAKALPPSHALTGISLSSPARSSPVDTSSG